MGTSVSPCAETFKARAKAIDAAWLQHTLEKVATQLEHLTAVTMWEDPIVTGGFVAACAAVAALLFAFVPFQWAVLFGGLYTMRPPSWRVVPGRGLHSPTSELNLSRF